MERKELGKLKSVVFGWGGYQDCQLGLSVNIEGSGWGVSDFQGFWGGKRSASASWTEADRASALANAVMYVGELLTAAKVKDVSQLAGVPVEAAFEGRSLKSWRILTEVL